MDKEAWVGIRVNCFCTSAQVTFLTIDVVLHEKIYKVASCLCLLIYTQYIITFIVHTSVAIVVVDMQCIQVVPALPANEVISVYVALHANEDGLLHAKVKT